MTQAAQRIELAAAALREAESKRRPLAAWPDGAGPRDLAEAYTVQDRFTSHLGRTIGYKIAYINPAVQRQLGIPSPLFGRLIEGRVARSPARLDPALFSNLLIETEFSFRIARALPARGAPFELEAVVDAVGAVIPSIELADTRFADWRRVPALDAAADNALGSHWVGGAELEEFRALDLAQLEVTTFVNGREASRGRGANVIGSPLLALRWLANELPRWGRGLEPGEIVTTGCCMDILELAPGDAAEADFGPLGRVRVEFPVSGTMRR